MSQLRVTDHKQHPNPLWLHPEGDLPSPLLPPHCHSISLFGCHPRRGSAVAVAVVLAVAHGLL
jgi:hypothetical protein